MAIVINQKPDGVRIGFDRGKFSGTSAYVILDDAGARINSSDIMGSTSVLAKLAPSDYYVGGSGALTDLGTYWSTRMRQVSFDLSQQDAGGFVWEATVNFDSNIGDASTTPVDQKNEQQAGFIAIEYSVQGEPVDVWRVNPTMPTGGNIDTPTETDIGGTKVDSGGEPISTFVNMARVTVRNVVVGRPTPPLSSINSRNSAAFAIGPYSFPARSLLFTGVQISRVGVSTYEVVYSFAYDAQFHLRQVAQRLAETREVDVGALADTCTGSRTSGKAYAACVVFKQPFPSTTAFSGLGLVT